MRANYIPVEIELIRLRMGPDVLNTGVTTSAYFSA